MAWRIANCWLLVLSLVTASALGEGLPVVDPATVGLRADRLAAIDALMPRAIASGDFCGGVVLIARHGRIAYLRAFGDRQVVPQRVPMTIDTVFDMASITKPVATATSILRLAEDGHVRLDERVAHYLPEFGTHGKESITVLQLLTHQGGLIPDNPLADYDQGPQVAWKRICDRKTEFSPGSRFVYTDVGFIVLGELIRRVSGLDVDAYSQRELFQPLGMIDTGYLPGPKRRARAEVTEQRDGQWLQGEVHDPRADALGGIAGHAGLFSTVSDLARFAQMLLNDGELQGHRILKPETVRLMTTAVTIPGAAMRETDPAAAASSNSRCLGWDHRSTYSINRGDFLSERAFGHGGFTGNVLWIDPEYDLFYVVLTNRLHPDGEGVVNPLAGRIGTIAISAIDSQGESDDTRGTRPVLTGIDVLERDNFEPLRGRRIGLITNHTGVNRHGTRTAMLFARAKDPRLVALFSPEHGLQGNRDEARIADSRDSETKVPVFSLYGATRRPTSTMLQGIDTLVFDIQDIGTRYYTYISTMGEAMFAAAEAGMPFVVLDRPNPIRGDRVEGPLLDAGRESFVGFHQLPVRHGMTVGELARMFQRERIPNLDLRIISLEGWRRNDWFDQTELPWISPSPNMRSLVAALLYPGIGWMETTNISVGRGTDSPFEVLGAPW
ncbi:MAG TPA: exo-beta-N-acetylmuramidase NamZ domain-containing protein, partial [Pirellulaceae bacterium]